MIRIFFTACLLLISMQIQVVAQKIEGEYTGKNKKIGGYLFAHMTRENYGDLYYSISKDGLHWETLNKSETVFDEYRGHPDIITGHDGKYYLLGNPPDGGTIRIWVLEDYINWEQFSDLQPDMSVVPEFNPVTYWHGALKMFYDSESKKYIITWHSTTFPRERRKEDPDDKLWLHYSDGSEELYDLEKDPNEWDNLANDAQYDETEKELSRHIPADWAPSLGGRLEVPQEFWDMFPLEEMSIDAELLKWIREDLQDLSKTGKQITGNTHFDKLLAYGIELDGEGGDVNAWTEYFRAYLATVAFSDRNIGLLVEAIEQSPRKDNTVVVLWSDHGYHVGDKNRTGKATLWEAANHCNLIIGDFRNSGKNNGSRVQSPVSLQDLYPTITSLAGLTKPKHVDGQDLSHVLQDPNAVRGKPVLNTHGKGNHSIRTDQYRYIRFANGDQELYDIRNDPFERSNLAIGNGKEELLGGLDNQLNEILHGGSK